MSNYWWLNANPKKDENNRIPFDWTTSVAVGQMQQWYSKKVSGGWKGNSRELIRGDKIIGYNTGGQREVVALAEVTQRYHITIDDEYVIDITKTEDVKPLSFYDIKKNEKINRLCRSRALIGTFIKLTKEEYDEIINMIG